MKKRMLTIAMIAFAVSLISACGGGDGGLQACKDWVATWNGLDCVTEGSGIDEGTTCPEATFDEASSAGCTWEAFYTTCTDTTECTGDPATPTHSCSGSCE